MSKVTIQIAAFASTFFFLHFSSIHAAGVDSSGGGNAVVCKDSNEQTVSAELLDLYEAENLFGLSIPSSNNPALDQAITASEAIGAGEAVDGSFGPGLIAIVKSVHSNMRILPPGVGLAPIDDSHSIVLPKNCKIIQLARYELNSMITVDGDIWNHLDNTNKAALLVHEGVYQLLRMVSGEASSIRTRLAVGKAFGGIKFQPVKEGIHEEAVECIETPVNGINPRWYFIAHKTAQGVTFNFLIVNGQVMLTQSTGALLGSDAWPFPGTKSKTFASIRLDSLLDGGTPILLFLERSENGTVKSYIDVSQQITMPKTEFFCK